jgi:hypothetical protein
MLSCHPSEKSFLALGSHSVLYEGHGVERGFKRLSERTDYPLRIP